MGAGKKRGGVVYSTDHGKMCPACGQPAAQCACRGSGGAVEGDGIVRVARDTKGRKGKCVTLITGVPRSHEELKKLAKQLKQKCGCGGTVKDGAIEIQGDHRDALVEELGRLGFSANPEKCELQRLGSLEDVARDNPDVVEELRAAAIEEMEHRGLDPALVEWLKGQGKGEFPKDFRATDANPAPKGWRGGYWNNIHSIFGIKSSVSQI